MVTVKVKNIKNKKTRKNIKQINKQKCKKKVTDRGYGLGVTVINKNN